MLSDVLQTRSVKPATAEPRLVIEHREALIYMICEAAELEHGLMCEYLFAAFSLKDGVGEGVSEDQLAATQRWRSTVLGVAAQEMLHLALTANMLTALGASPHLLTTLPVGPGSPGLTAGATFELFYQPDYLLPHHRAAWLLMSERMAEAATLAAHLSTALPVLTPIAAALFRLADQVGAGATSSEE